MTNPKEQDIRERFRKMPISNQIVWDSMNYVQQETMREQFELIADFFIGLLHSDREAVREKIEAILFDAQFQLKANPDDFMQWLSQRLLSPNK